MKGQAMISEQEGPATLASERAHRGLQYVKFLGRLFETARPTSYLEIGTRDGRSLEAFGCDAICVDPTMRPNPKALRRRQRTFCYQMTSDQFFHEHDPLSVFPRGVDVAFLDGMHRFEYALRDFINTERCCHQRSMIIVHDCFPTVPDITSRMPAGGAWAGDVWKLVPILKELREDLVLRMLDCPPTGLLVVQNIKPDSDALQSQYHSLVGRYGPMTLQDYGIARLWSDVESIDSRGLAEDESLWSIYLSSY